MKDIKKTNDNIPVNHNNRGNSRKEEAMSYKLFAMVATLVATFILLPTSVWAQTTPPSPYSVFDDAHYLQGELTDDLGRNKRLFSQGTTWAKNTAPDYMSKKLNKDVAEDADREKIRVYFNDTLLPAMIGVFEPMASMSFDQKMKAWEKHVTDKGCDLGNPSSDGCKAIYDGSKRIREAIIPMVTDAELRSNVEGFILVGEEYLGADMDNDGTADTEDDYSMLALFEQAAIFSLPYRFWLPFVSDENQFAGDLVTFDDLADKHGGYVTLSCVPFGTTSGRLSGSSTSDTLVLEQDGKTKANTPATREELRNCKIFYLDTGAPTPFEEAKLAVANSDPTLHGSDLMLAYDPSMIDGKLVTIFREGADTIYDAEPENITDDGFEANGESFTAANYGVTYIVTIREKAGEPDRKAILTPELGYGMQFGVGGSIDGTSIQTIMAGLVFNPFNIGNKSVMGDRGSLKFKLSLGALQVMKGYNPSYTAVGQSPSKGDRWDFCGEFGAIGGVRFAKWFELTLSANLAWTTGGPGFSSDLLARFWVHDHIELFVGPKFSYLQLNTKGLGDNDMMLEEDKLDEFELISMGFVLGIAFPF